MDNLSKYKTTRSIPQSSWRLFALTDAAGEGNMASPSSSSKGFANSVADVTAKAITPRVIHFVDHEFRFATGKATLLDSDATISG
jgi:hypothetical protein